MDDEKDLTKIVAALFQGENSWEEGLQLEFKSAQGGLPKEIWPTYSAFANTRGGIILLGVGDDGSIEGIRNLNQRSKEFVDAANNPQKCSVNLCGPEDIAVVKLEGKQVLAIRVPRADCADLPVSVHGFSYKRFGEADKRCSSRELDILLSERLIVTRDDYTEDEAIFENTSLDDIDLNTLNQYRNRLQTAKPDNPWSGESNRDFLISLNAYRKDRKTGKEGLTLAGLLMFGNARALTELKPSLQLDYQEYDGTEGKDIHRRWIDRLENDGTWAGNLYQFFFNVLPKLLLGLKTPFALDSSLLRVDESPAHVAVREALANALVHASYLGECVIKIVKTPSGLIFENSGNLLLRKERIMAGGLSRCRNKRVQNMLRQIGVVDKAGSGVAKIRRGWAELCMCPPQVRTDDDPDIVQWILPFVGIVPKEKVDYVLGLLHDIQRQSLNADDYIVISLLTDGQWHNNEALRKLYPIHPVDMRKILSKLRNSSIVISKGKSVAMEYALRPEYLVSGKEGNSLGKEGNSLGKEGNSLGKEGNSLGKEGNSLGKEGNSLGKEGNLFGCFSPLLREKIEKTRTKQRGSVDGMLDLILEICTDRYVSLIQLAALLNRNAEHIRSKYVQVLLWSGKLETRHAEKNHPDQSYRAKCIVEKEQSHRP